MLHFEQKFMNQIQKASIFRKNQEVFKNCNIKGLSPCNIKDSDIKNWPLIPFLHSFYTFSSFTEFVPVKDFLPVIYR